ncbi:MAG: hypothetical protein R6U95_02450 [Bacteroidales bacterium]
MYKFLFYFIFFTIVEIQVLAQNVVDDSVLFVLDLNVEDKSVKITPLTESDFWFLDSTVTRIVEIKDFNADNKEDALIYLGACGSGGCMYGVFFKQHKNFYKLVFMDYLKTPVFNKEDNGYISLTSYEEVEPYNPSEIYVTKYVFDEKIFQYTKDTTYIAK